MRITLNAQQVEHVEEESRTITLTPEQAQAVEAEVSAAAQKPVLEVLAAAGYRPGQNETLANVVRCVLESKGSEVLAALDKRTEAQAETKRVKDQLADLWRRHATSEEENTAGILKLRAELDSRQASVTKALDEVARMQAERDSAREAVNERKREDFIRALRAFTEAATDLCDVWTNLPSADDATVTGYPEWLPNFEDVPLDLAEWLEKQLEAWTKAGKATPAMRR